MKAVLPIHNEPALDIHLYFLDLLEPAWYNWRCLQIGLWAGVRSVLAWVRSVGGEYFQICSHEPVIVICIWWSEGR